MVIGRHGMELIIVNNMNKQQIEYIESGLESILATQATLLSLNLSDNPVDDNDDRRTEKVISTLMFLHKHYKLVKKETLNDTKE